MNQFPCLVRTSTAGGEDRYALGDPLIDSYLAFVAGRSRPNTLRAVAHDLKMFFIVIAKDPMSSPPTSSSSSPTSAATAAWFGSATASRDCRRARSPGACHRSRACTRTWSPAVTRP